MKKLFAVLMCLSVSAVLFYRSAQAQLFPIIAPFQFADMDVNVLHKNLYGDLPVKPGTYSLVNLNSQSCAKIAHKSIPPNKLELGFCSHPSLDYFSKMEGNVSILPAPDGSYTLRSWRSGSENGLRECLTVARGVLIGASDIDELYCDIPVNNSGWNFVGTPDQRFRLLPTGNGYFEIRTQDNKCFAVRDASKGLGAGIIKWDCTGGADQKWRADFMEPINRPLEIEALNQNFWYQVGNQFFMAKPIGGKVIQGKQIRKFANPNDNGKKCGMHCLDDASCKAFTWRPTVLDNSCNGQSCCSLFSSVTNMSTPNDGSYSGVVIR